MSELRIVLSGKAVICCPHDREKRQVTTDAQVVALGIRAGQVYDPRIHKIHRCACCGNLFVDTTDIPRFCRVCESPLVHALGGPLPDPIGVTK